MMFKRVRNSVRAETNGQQTPWESSSLYGKDFYFAGKISKEEQKRIEEIKLLKKEEQEAKLRSKIRQEKLKKLQEQNYLKKVPKKVQKFDKKTERQTVIPTM